MSRCQHGVWDGACNVCKPIHSSRDQQWHFDYPFKPGDTVPIHSKGKFLKECRKRGQVWTGVEDLVSHGTPYHPNQKPLDTSKFRPAMEQVFKESRNPALVNKKWNELKSAGKVKEG